MCWYNWKLSHVVRRLRIKDPPRPHGLFVKDLHQLSTEENCFTTQPGQLLQLEVSRGIVPSAPMYDELWAYDDMIRN